MAAGDGLSKVVARLGNNRGSRRTATILVSLCVLIAALLPGHQPILRLFAAKHYRPVPYRENAQRALDAIPAGVSVVAQSPIVPHLGHRRELYVLDRNAPDAEYFVASSDVSPWPLGSQDEARQLIAARRARGYETVLEAGNWVVLRRPR
jgi:hypothetical protein